MLPTKTANSSKSNAKNNVISVPVAQEIITPCVPSPCGPNAICREQNGAGSCSCIADYIGNPYEGCRPECVLNSDCPSDKACIRGKCADPCPGTCGQNAECQTINHLPTCTCINGFTGDPFRYCNLPPPERKLFTYLIVLSLYDIFPTYSTKTEKPMQPFTMRPQQSMSCFQRASSLFLPSWF